MAAAVNLLPEINLAATPNVTDPVSLAASLEARCSMGAMSAAVGSTSVWNGSYLFDSSDASDDEYMTDVSTGDMSLEENDVYFWMSNISTVHTLSKSNANSVKKLAKAWKLDHATAQRTINANTQRNERNHSHTLERNTNTNDRFYRYRHINDCLYMDTMIAAKKNGKSTRQNTCAHIMVTDKGYIKAYPLEKRAHVKDAIRRFCKDIGVPVAFIFFRQVNKHQKK